MSQPVVTLTFDLLTPRPNQYVSRPSYTCDLILLKWAVIIAAKILHSPGFPGGHLLLWPWRLTFWSQKLMSTSMNRDTSVTKTEWNSLHWFLRYDVHKVFRMHRLTYRLTHGRTQTKSVCLRHRRLSVVKALIAYSHYSAGVCMTTAAFARVRRLQTTSRRDLQRTNGIAATAWLPACKIITRNY